MARGFGKSVRRGLGLVALGLLGGFGASASTPVGETWSADPEEQYLLDVSLRQNRLGNGVRAYETPEGTCVLFGDFIAALDVPVRIDLVARKASGWTFRESNRIEVDLAGRSVTFGSSTEPLSPTTVRETPEGWCIDTGALSRWFGITVKPSTSASALILESEAKLPVELAAERAKRAENLLKKAKFDISSLPMVKLPYRLWRAPALDFVVSAGATYSGAAGLKVDRRSSIYAAGEVAKLSYDGQVATNDKGVPSTVRLRIHRSDPDGGLLGPLGATQVAFGDVLAFDSRLGGTAASGRGAFVTNRPLFNPTTFDRSRFEGDLPPGWEAELYRNGELIAFAKPTADQRYVFDDVQLFYGENRVSVILYGPQGQVRSRDELINVGIDNVPAGKTWYWAGFNQPGRDLVDFHRTGSESGLPKLQAAVSVDHGLDSRTSIGALARTLLVEDERVTFLEGSVRRSIGPALVEIGAARDSSGGTAARAQMVARLGSVNLSANALIANDFYVSGGRQSRAREFKLSADAPIRLGRTTIPAHADVRMTSLGDGTRQLEAAARLATTINRFNLATDIRYRRQYLAHGPAPPGKVEVAAIGAGRIGDVRLRGSTMFEAAPQPRFRSAELSAYWSASDTADWEGAVGYDSSFRRGRARVTHIRRFDGLALALTGEAATDGSLAAGINLNFSLDPTRGMRFSRQRLAGAGVVHARIYRDLNDNGVHDQAEPFEQGAMITAGSRVIEKPTDSRGMVLVGGLGTYAPIAIGVDLASLDDPTLVPKKALQVVVPRPGVAAEVEIGLVGGGAIEGSIVRNGGLGLEGLELILVDSEGKTVASTRSDFDGYFLFDRVPHGTYSIRVSAESAAIAGIAADLNVQAALSEAQSVARVGSIAVEPLPRIASVE